ncbi:MAG: PilZ domain-containing protein [Bdellovibrionales bacterium]
MEILWSLYNRFEKLRVDDLTAAQVRMILLAIPTARLPDWYACREGEVHWHPLSSIPEFYEDVRDIKGAGIPLQHLTPPRRPLFEDPPDGLVTDTSLTVDLAETQERRNARRYMRQFSFRVTSETSEFNTHTVDISMSGIALKDELPEWVPRVFRASLENKGRSIQVMCARVDGYKVQLREAESWEQLRQWIASW